MAVLIRGDVDGGADVVRWIVVVGTDDSVVLLLDGSVEGTPVVDVDADVDGDDADVDGDVDADVTRDEAGVDRDDADVDGDDADVD